MCSCFTFSNITTFKVRVYVVACNFGIILFFRAIENVLIRIYLHIFRSIRSIANGETELLCYGHFRNRSLFKVIADVVEHL